MPFEVRDVSVDELAAREMVQRTRQMGVPVIADEHEAIVGFDLPRLQRVHLVSSSFDSVNSSCQTSSHFDRSTGFCEVPAALLTAATRQSNERTTLFISLLHPNAKARERVTTRDALSQCTGHQWFLTVISCPRTAGHQLRRFLTISR